MDTFIRNNISKKNNPWSEEFTFLKLTIRPLFLEDLPKMVHMFTFSLAIYKDIIKINNRKQTIIRPAHVIHESHESTYGIGQSKWHDKRFIKPLLGFKGSLPLISLLIPIWWYPLLRSVLKKTFESCSSSNMLSSLEMVYLYLTVMLLMALLSRHILQLPSFFGARKART